MQPTDFKPGDGVLLKLTGPVEVSVTRIEGQYVVVEVQATPDQLTKLADGMTLDTGGGLG
jgi:hypothetical protein